MSTTTQAKAQTSIYEKVIEDDRLEGLLDERAQKKAAAAAAAKKAKEIDVAVKLELEKLDIADAPVRIGNYVVSYSDVAARSVAWEAASTTRLVIKTIETEA